MPADSAALPAKDQVHYPHSDCRLLPDDPLQAAAIMNVGVALTEHFYRTERVFVGVDYPSASSAATRTGVSRRTCSCCWISTRGGAGFTKGIIYQTPEISDQRFAHTGDSCTIMM